MLVGLKAALERLSEEIKKNKVEEEEKGTKSRPFRGR